MNRIKSIDGWRAIAIIMVLLGHAYETIPAWLSQNRLLHYLGNGQLGVRIFFVISGYLITKLLIIEKEKNGDISLKDFYLRRVFRIFPVFYLYIIVLILLKIFLVPNIFSSYLLVISAALYLWNYKQYISIPETGNGYWFMGHFWSLSMEEQFYRLKK